MAYYDLANDQDGNPELHIRVAYYPRIDDRCGNHLYNSLGTDQIFVEPDERAGLELGLQAWAGGNSRCFDERSAVWTVSCQHWCHTTNLPNWVINNTWEWQTFVARENGPYQSSEGIYDWSADVSAKPNVDYLTGSGPTSPLDEYSNITPDCGVKFGCRQHSTNMLYFSPDRSSTASPVC